MGKRIAALTKERDEARQCLAESTCQFLFSCTQQDERIAALEKAIVDRGCGERKIETQDGTEFDCDHEYPWDCDNCPINTLASGKEGV